MEIETLFTTSKWNILEEIAKKPDAPLGIAKKLNTTIANVSQQLRLLEAAGLVKKQRIANVGAGQPRALFSLSNNFAFFTLVSRGVAKKELVNLSDIQVAVTRILLLNKECIANNLIKFLYLNENLLNNVSEIYFSHSNESTIFLEFISDETKIDEQIVESQGKKMKIKISYVKIQSSNAILVFNGKIKK